jgi:hypothetical protein
MPLQAAFADNNILKGKSIYSLVRHDMEVIVETFRNPGEASSRPIRVRPIAGQFKEKYRVVLGGDAKSEASRLTFFALM